MIELLPELFQQVKYKGVDTLNDIHIAEKKEGSLKSTPIILPKDSILDIYLTPLRASSLTNTFYPSNKPSRIVAAMEQRVSQITQLSVHLFQPRVFCNHERNSNKVEYYTCKKMKHISRSYPNRDATGGPSTRRVTFVDNKDELRVNLVEIQDETRENTIANFEQFLRNEIDVIAAKQI
jgi:hypothetical protein